MTFSLGKRVHRLDQSFARGLSGFERAIDILVLDFLFLDANLLDDWLLPLFVFASNAQLSRAPFVPSSASESPLFLSLLWPSSKCL
jgi:hypothetical protein